MITPTGIKHPQALFDYLVGVDHSGITSYIKVYSVRMYNRALTDVEVNSNFSVDEARYGE
jgi:predicted class III extradiol MEMO1 family dioxygenase